MNEHEFQGLAELLGFPVISEDDPRAAAIDGVVSDDPGVPAPENRRNPRYEGTVLEADSPEAVRRYLGTPGLELRGTLRSETDDGPIYRTYFWKLREGSA